MTRLRRLRSISTRVLRALVGLIAAVLVLLGAALAAIETGWAKNRIRGLIVRQANEYLTATLQIGRLEGSLLRGIQLGDVSVSRAGATLIHVDEIALVYSIRELIQPGVVIRSVRLTRPVIVGGRQPDGRWDLGALVKRESREQERTGPSRPIEVQSIEVFDGRISLRDPLDFGAAHVPTEFEKLDAKFRFAYFPVRWTLTFDRVSWIGRAPDLSVTRLAGVLGHGPGGWFFERFSVETPRSAFTISGRVNRDRQPTELDLSVNAARFAFQEWAGVLRGLKNIAVDASFDTSLKGPVTALDTQLRLAGTGGSVTGRLTLDTTVPGWHGSGAVDVGRLNLARWLNRSDRPSDITGHVTFDLALELGRHFPRGVYSFAGPHAMYMEYAGDDVRARGQITAASVLVAHAAAVAYGANVTISDGTIGIDDPFPFRFQGTAAHVDLRRVPENVPVPHVESVLTFDYDVSGQFSKPFINGHATFAPSAFLGAAVGAGTTGSIDTSQKPVRFTGDGDVAGLSLHRFGEGLDVGWLRDPRYDGTLAGHFRVDGSGTDAAALALTGGGRVAHAEIFNGVLSDADVAIDISGGTVHGSYNGELTTIDPAIPFADPRFASSLTGSGNVTITARDLLTRDTSVADYEVQGALTLRPSTVRNLHVDRGQLEAALANSTLTVSHMELSGPEIEGKANGSLALAGETVSDFSYDLSRVDLARVRSMTGLEMSGLLSTKGRASGPSTALRLVGDANVMQLDAFDVRATTLSGAYDVTVPGDLAQATVRVEGRGSFLSILDQSIQQASGTVTYDAQRIGFDLALILQEGRNGNLAGHVLLRQERHEATLQDLTITLGSSPWRLVPQTPPPTVTWSDAGLAITPVEFVDGREDERIRASGTWRYDGSGALRVTATHVFLDTIGGVFKQPARYGGVMDIDATIRGTREHPRVAATLTVGNGRIERVTYQQLTGRVNYTDQNLDIDLRLDQSPGIWITAVGTVPLALFTADGPDQPIDVAIKSSGINLGLLEGLTDVVHDVTGELHVDVKAVGTTRDPHFEGSINIAGAAFAVSATGAKYKNASAALTLSRDRIGVDALRVVDANGRALDVRGSLGTHELRVGDLEIEMTAQRFEVLRNELGRMEIDAALRLRGRYEAPRLAGNLTISSGNIQVDEILQRTLFQPYSTVPTAMAEVDAVAALNPWNRLGLDVFLHVPNTLRLTGENVQISTGTPIGLGDINLRVLGDLYLYKDPGQPMSVTGSFDRLSGTYAFQGRRFEVDPASSINFRGEVDNPEIYVTVTRVISGVETRVSIFGPLQQPELRLASNPTLDASDILSLIVFNTSTNQLSSGQQQELMVRAGTLAAGFLAAPIVSAIENEIGIDLLELEPGGDFGAGPRVTIGEEIAPGLVARFSRQFGQEPYDEATIEYYLSRLLRLRATFSDAQSLNSRSPFRRVERAGIDLLLYFSF